MVEQTVTQQADAAARAASKEPVSAEEYMARYAHDFYEWVGGELIRMTLVSYVHDQIAHYLRSLLEAYLTLRPIGRVVAAPFVMHLEATESRREPDLQVILNDNPGDLTDTAMVGPADICIEIVSPESAARDHGEKFTEYEKAGVREYWIIDPVRNEGRFCRLGNEEVYVTALAGREGRYETALLPGLVVDVAVLWQEKLPDFFEIGERVKAMLAG
jgi:Uma2 family endonuclease